MKIARFFSYIFACIGTLLLVGSMGFFLWNRNAEVRVMQLPQEAAAYLLEKTGGKDGARQLRRLVQSEVEGPLASFLLGCSRKPGKVKLRLESGKVSFCS